MTKSLADKLWQRPEPNKLPSFAEQIDLTRKAVMDSMLLIEEEHYNDLDKLLKNFEDFQFGKRKLIDIRSSEDQEETTNINITKDEVKRIIDENEDLKEEYTSLIMKIGTSFREQIRG